jgi:hypothetical protein
LATCNAYGPDTRISYINHQENHKKKYCFCKRESKDEMEILWVMFLLRRCFKETEGAKPMNIKWELKGTNA